MTQWDEDEYRAENERLVRAHEFFEHAAKRVVRACRLLEYVCSECGQTVLAVMGPADRIAAVMSAAGAGEPPTWRFIVTRAQAPGLSRHGRPSVQQIEEAQSVARAAGSDFTEQSAIFGRLLAPYWDPTAKNMDRVAQAGPMPIADNFETAPHHARERVVAMCRHRRWQIPARQIADDLATGRSKRTLKGGSAAEPAD